MDTTDVPVMHLSGLGASARILASGRSTEPKMDYYEFETRNLRAAEQARVRLFGSREVGECNQRLRHSGFVNCCAAQDQPSFVMFNNADDVVAAHYYYAGPHSFETDTLRLWVHLARQANYIYDVGAFSGVFSLAAVAANPTCFVMAFEPAFNTYSRLLINVRANAFDDRIAPLRAGVGSSEGTHDLRHPSGVYVLSSDESFVEDRVSKPWFTETVPMVSLDQLLADQDRYRTQIVLEVPFPSVDLIKIDVEGYEPEVLKGMTQVVARDRPTAIIELFDVSETAGVLALLGPGYQARYLQGLPYTPTGANVVFIHEQKLHQIAGYEEAHGPLRQITPA
ncbi:FkbM family methyltransferase [Sphingomonas glaciei]|uniref:FkbM family methyltransferase n=1 Tax=Sphingomonas glaciei TaxID=2938948 RepID=A0ABY5MUC7_9SPHN|nr:FkbM family methyltransferase [Sphingomonas glaciei]UUR08090.1 FkbM family methyltransferase [Sphingomonas glaciei]